MARSAISYSQRGRRYPVEPWRLRLLYKMARVRGQHSCPQMTQMNADQSRSCIEREPSTLHPSGKLIHHAASFFLPVCSSASSADRSPAPSSFGPKPRASGWRCLAAGASILPREIVVKSVFRALSQAIWFRSVWVWPGWRTYTGWRSARFAVNGGVEECRNSWSRLSKRPDSSRKGIKKPSPQSSFRRSSRSGGGGNCSHSRSRPTFSRAWRMRLWPRSERAVQVSSTSKSYELVSDAAVLGAVRGLARACSPAGPASLRVVPARSSGDTIRSSGPGGPRGLLPWGSHRSGRVEQETHLVTPPRPTSQVPIIGFSALLQLVEWYQVRLRRNQQGGSSCVDPQPPLSPPAPDQGSPSPQSAPALAQLDRRIPRANPGHPQSRRGPAARSASSHPGGDQ